MEKSNQTENKPQNEYLEEKMKVTVEDIANEIIALKKDNIPCKNCPKNKNAAKPYTELVEVKITPLTEKVVNRIAERYGLEEKSCLFCLAIDNITKLPSNKQFDYLKATKQEKPN